MHRNPYSSCAVTFIVDLVTSAGDLASDRKVHNPYFFVKYFLRLVPFDPGRAAGIQWPRQTQEGCDDHGGDELRGPGREGAGLRGGVPEGPGGDVFDGGTRPHPAFQGRRPA